jgi:chromosome segregation ATPase
MKRVNLKQLVLTNFKKHKSLVVNFGEHTTISGDNRMGKSTVFDAFTWLLFGKDQFDRKDHEIFPIINNVRLDRVDAEVYGLLEVDGAQYHLKRIFRQIWSRPRGKSEEVYKGNETLFFVNDVPKKAGEYKAIIDGIIDETVFKLITKPNAFLDLNWAKQRDILFKIAEIESNEQIAFERPKYAELLSRVNEFTSVVKNIVGDPLVEYKKQQKSKIAKLNEALEDIQPRIDQTTRLTPEAKDYAAVERELTEVDAEILGIALKMSDRSEAIRDQYNNIQEKQGQINTLKSKQVELVQKAKEKAQKDAFEANQLRNELENRVTASLKKFNSISEERTATQREGEKLVKQTETVIKEIEKLRTQWEQENEREYKAVAGCLICPVFGTECGDQLAQGKHQEAQDKAQFEFIKTKETRLDEINQLGVAQTEELKALNLRMDEVEKSLKGYAQEIDALDIEYETLKQQLNSTPVVVPKEVIAEAIPEWVTIQKEINAITSTIQEVKPIDNSDLSAKKQELTDRRDVLKKQLSERDLIAKHKEEIESLKADGSKLTQQIADIEREVFLVEEFMKVKIDKIEQPINSLFKIVRFKLFDTTNEGNEFEACIAVDTLGVPISATNTEGEINAGLDIINALSKFFQVSAPIFCDRAESVNLYIPTGSQMVFLKVTKEKVLTIQ